MQRVSLEVYNSAYEAVKILTGVADHRVELEIPVGSVLLDNILNLRIIEEAAKKSGKEVSFSTNDPAGKNLIKLLSGEKDEVIVREPELVRPAILKKPKVKIPSLSLPKLTFGVNFRKVGMVIPLIVLLAAAAGFFVLKNQHKAIITLYFAPQVQTKSVTVKVGDGMRLDLDKKILGGIKVARTLEHALTADSTGSKLEGEKAKGKVTIYNYTDKEVSVKKGAKFTYKNKDKTYSYLINDDVKIPASTTTLPSPPAIVITTTTPGTAQAEVTAESIGDMYNIKKDKELTIKDYDSDEVKAVSTDDFKGGSSKEVQIVTEADITKLQAALATYVSTQPADTLKNAVATGYVYVDKSAKVANNSVVITNKVGDEKSELSGSITAQVEGLTYSKSELADFMGKVSQNLVPPGFEFHSYNNDIKVEVLGNTEKTVLSPTEADLQVTFRFNISPTIDKQKVFNDIKGMSLQEAEEYLSKISDVQKTELEVKPGILFFRKIPTDMSDVVIQTKIQE